MEKTYSILIQFGDGKPVASKIRAKNGIDAQDKALALNPGAFSIRVTGVLKVHHPIPKPPKVSKQTTPSTAVVPNTDLFTDVPEKQLNGYLRIEEPDNQLLSWRQTNARPLSSRSLSRQLGVSQSVIKQWID